MTEADIANAMGQRLALLPAIAVTVFENANTVPALPYIWAEMVPTSRIDASIAGGSAVSRGYMMATVIVPMNGFATRGRQMADQIIARFPARLILPITGGKVIIGDAQIVKAYPDGVAWRQPVRVNYTAIKA